MSGRITGRDSIIETKAKYTLSNSTKKTFCVVYLPMEFLKHLMAAPIAVSNWMIFDPLSNC